VSKRNKREQLKWFGSCFSPLRGTRGGGGIGGIEGKYVAGTTSNHRGNNIIVH